MRTYSKPYKVKGIKNEIRSGGLGEMRILLTGSSGMLGRECEAILKDDYEVIDPKKR